MHCACMNNQCMNASRATHECITCHTWMHHVPHMNASRATHECITCHTWMHHVPHMNGYVSWVMHQVPRMNTQSNGACIAHASMRHVPHTNTSRHTHTCTCQVPHMHTQSHGARIAHACMRHVPHLSAYVSLNTRMVHVTKTNVMAHATGWRKCMGCLIFIGRFPQKSLVITLSTAWKFSSKSFRKRSFFGQN